MSSGVLEFGRFVNRYAGCDLHKQRWSELATNDGLRMPCGLSADWLGPDARVVGQPMTATAGRHTRRFFVRRPAGARREA